MADIDDRWYRTAKGPDGKALIGPDGKPVRVPTARHGTGKRWDVRWRDDADQQRHKAFDRKPDAERHLAKVIVDLASGTYLDASAGRITVKQYGEVWRAGQLHRDSTVDRVERAFRLHIDPLLGHLQLRRVRSAHLKAWVKDRSGELAPSTLRVVYSYLAAMFKQATIDRKIGVSPCIGIRLPDLDHDELVIPTPEQVHAVAAALPAHYRAVAYLVAGTGLRGGELFGLELDAVDFLRREIHVRQQLKVLAGRKPFLGPPKTATSRRTVELPEVVRLALARHLKQFPAVEVELDDETDRRRLTRRVARLVFTNARGEPVHRASWSHVMAPAVATAGLPPRFGLHGLRDFFATSLIHAGASVKTVQLALGHTTPTITLNTYVGQWPEAVDRTRAILDAALGASKRDTDDRRDQEPAL